MGIAAGSKWPSKDVKKWFGGLDGQGVGFDHLKENQGHLKLKVAI
jgi:hypothetical protein